MYSKLFPLVGGWRWFQRAQSGHEHGHGHAFSSQSIVLHQAQHHQPQHHQSQHHQLQCLRPRPRRRRAPPRGLLRGGPHGRQQVPAREPRRRRGHGVYSLHEADGTRVVEYTADKHNGFNAVVRREGHAKHEVSAPSHYHH
ncbi:Adult-specific cuticular protein ACP-20 [Eumeta japonica]|uniref:Adult-specific cuticular protein ACP-20 n=1 Tax=Eumeta variegata TaxID=151549 RepID=A0A4C1X041_EUMVA|nr:Adult-specific cuticular protein ACP-20 [Eumeta japonica]